MPTWSTIQVGLLLTYKKKHIPIAYRLYKSTRSRDENLVSRFKDLFCRTVPVDFLGVW